MSNFVCVLNRKRYSCHLELNVRYLSYKRVPLCLLVFRVEHVLCVCTLYHGLNSDARSDCPSKCFVLSAVLLVSYVYPLVSVSHVGQSAQPVEVFRVCPDLWGIFDLFVVKLFCPGNSVLLEPVLCSASVCLRVLVASRRQPVPRSASLSRHL